MQKRKADIIDIFSRKPLQSQAPAADVSEIIEHGEYVGKLPKGAADHIRGCSEELHQHRAQIDHLIARYTITHERYMHSVAAALVLLRGKQAELLDLEKNSIYVDLEGHLWMVPNEDDEEPNG